MRGAYAKRFSGDAPPAALRFSVEFRSFRLLRRVPVSGGAERRRLYIIYGHTSQGQTRTKPYVNRISTAPERSCQNEAIFELFSGDFATEFSVRFSALKRRPFDARNTKKFQRIGKLFQMCRKTTHLRFRIEAYPEISTINSKSACSVFLPLRFLSCYPHKKKTASLLSLKENILHFR